MSGWGLGEWGITPWGGGLLEECAVADPPLQIVIRYPAPNAEDVPPNEIVKVGFFDFNDDLDLSTAYIVINGIAAYGGNQFLNGYVGQTTTLPGFFSVELFNPLGYPFDSQISVRAHIANSNDECVDETWWWRTAGDPVCYTGVTPNKIELALQTPFTSFLDLEFIRRLMFKLVLRTRQVPIKNYDNKAARVIYQLGYSTELSTVLNTYVEKRKVDLETIVCEREKAIVIDKGVFKYEDRLLKSINALANRGIFTREYISAFHDYKDSVNYNFRVSLVANLLMSAKAIELQETNE